MSVLFGGCGFIGVAFALLAFGFWIWMIIDCLQNPYLQGTDKIVMLIVIVFLHFIGALIYYLVGRKRRV